MTVFQTIRIFRIGDRKYKIGIDSKSATQLGVASALGGPGGVMAVGAAVQARLDPWWTQALKQAGVPYKITLWPFGG